MSSGQQKSILNTPMNLPGMSSDSLKTLQLKRKRLKRGILCALLAIASGGVYFFDKETLHLG